MMTFLDLDGVIIDSFNECYEVSCETYYAYTKPAFPRDQYKNLFYRYRGLVGPAYQYLSLHRALEKYFFKFSARGAEVIPGMFHESVKHVSEDEADAFEKKFFFTRSLYQERDFPAWIALNPLTQFGKSLVKKSNGNIYIVTTKNKQATKAILDYHQIRVMAIYASNDIKKAGSKGALIGKVLDESSETEALFVDDNVDHLNTVKDRRISCYFAAWGYGENTNYQEYKFK
jgi:phosphoglycolate phosphatase-like HAD superfamily hydrolase